MGTWARVGLGGREGVVEEIDWKEMVRNSDAGRLRRGEAEKLVEEWEEDNGEQEER